MTEKQNAQKRQSVPPNNLPQPSAPKIARNPLHNVNENVLFSFVSKDFLLLRKFFSWLIRREFQ